MKILKNGGIEAKTIETRQLTWYYTPVYQHLFLVLDFYLFIFCYLFLHWPFVTSTEG